MRYRYKIRIMHLMQPVACFDRVLHMAMFLAAADGGYRLA
jgi:hypothetical protein